MGWIKAVKASKTNPQYCDQRFSNIFVSTVISYEKTLLNLTNAYKVKVQMNKISL